MVVALAMVAVFGAMSLTPNPAFAADPPVLDAAGGPNRVVLTWTYTADTNVTVAGWDMRSKEPDGGYGNFAPMTTSGTNGALRTETISGLENGIAYTFQIRPKTADVPLERSNEVTATPAAAPAGTYADDTGVVGENAGEVDLEWTWTAGPGSIDVVMWQYNAVGTGNGEETDRSWTDTGLSGAGTKEYTVTGLGAGNYDFMVRPVGAAGTAGDAETISVTGVTQAPAEPTFVTGSNKPSANTRYDISFPVILEEGDTFNTVTDDIVIELEDYNVPSSISESSVALSPNPPKDTDGRVEDSGRGVRELQGRYPGLHWGRWEVRRTVCRRFWGCRWRPAVAVMSEMAR